MNAAGIFSANGGRKRLAAALVVALLAIAPALAINFPALTGRVVDQANIIQPDTRVAIEQKLADLEATSGIQLVVATVNSLEGQEVEPYANELFRKWALGEKQKNNGVLLLVAPNERRVRIEVGYGLEGTLTDALSKVIISNAMAPRFKAGNFSEGTSRGVDDIITVLTTDASEWQKRPSLRLDYQQPVDPANWILLAALFGFFILFIVSPTFRWLFFNIVLNVLASSGSSRGGYSGGSYSGGGGCARDALAAGDLHLYASPPNPVRASHHICRSSDDTLHSCCADCTGAAQSEARDCLPRRHGAIHQPRHRAKCPSLRYIDLCFAGRTLCAYHCRRRDREKGSAFEMAGGRRCPNCARA